MWIGSYTRGGYGKFNPKKGNVVRAHRWLYVQLIGDLDATTHLHHICRNTSCVNPGHMRPVTARQHMYETPSSPALIRHLQTHCIHGHPFDEKNTYVRLDTGHRKCRACNAERMRKAVRHAV